MILGEPPVTFGSSSLTFPQSQGILTIGMQLLICCPVILVYPQLDFGILLSQKTHLMVNGMRKQKIMIRWTGVPQ